MAGDTISDCNGDEPIKPLDSGNGDEPIKPLDSGNGDEPTKPLDSRNGANKEIQEPNYDEEALRKYQSEGFGQNAFGHYFNPHENDFDENYNPVEDEDYNQRVKNENEALQRYQNEGFGQNAFGHYFNPSKNEFDAEYDPRTDKAFNKGLDKPENANTKELNKPENVDNKTIENSNNDENVKIPERQSVPTPQKTVSSTTSKPKKITGSRGRAGKMTLGDRVKGAGRASWATYKQAGKGFIRGAKQGVRKAPGVVAGAMIGGTAAVVGASLGLAAGDPSKALSYGGAGAVAGGTLGKRTFTISPRSGQQSAEKIAAERAFYGDKYDDHVAEKNMKKWRRDDEKRQELERYLGAEKVKALYKGNKDAKINEYLKNEITDAKDIAALEQLQEKKKVSFNDALVFYDAHSRYGDIPNGDVKKRKEIKADYAEKFEQRGTSKEVADKKAQDILDMTHEFDSIKKDLNKA